MPEVGIVMTLRDRVSNVMKSMINSGHSLSKEFDDLYARVVAAEEQQSALDKEIGETTASMVQSQFQMDPFQTALFLFCGRKRDRIKALYWEGDGFLLLYKRLENGSFQWPRTKDEVRALTPQQYRWLMVIRNSLYSQSACFFYTAENHVT